MEPNMKPNIEPNMEPNILPNMEKFHQLIHIISINQPKVE